MTHVEPVAKVLIINPEGDYLLLHRSAHPTLPQGDPDLAGGVVESHETTAQAVVREAQEEVGVEISEEGLMQRYKGTEYSSVWQMYHLFEYQLVEEPEVVISWEHESYEWLDKASFIAQCQTAADSYMGMVAAVLKQ